MTYQIMITPCYLAGTHNAPSERLLTWNEIEGGQYRRERDEIAEFETRQAAEAAIEVLEEGTYYLAHGEAGRPDYTIIEDLDYGPDCLPAVDYAELPSAAEIISYDELPDEVASRLDVLSVDFYAGSDVQTWIATIENEDGVTWGVAYCPRSVAIDTAADMYGDLSAVNWDNECYFRID